MIPPNGFVSRLFLCFRLQWEALHDEQLTLSVEQPQEVTWLLHHPQSTHGGIRGKNPTMYLTLITSSVLKTLRSFVMFFLAWKTKWKWHLDILWKWVIVVVDSLWLLVEIHVYFGFKLYYYFIVIGSVLFHPYWPPEAVLQHWMSPSRACAGRVLIPTKSPVTPDDTG